MTLIIPFNDLIDLYRRRFCILYAVYQAAMVPKADLDGRIREAEHIIVTLLDGLVSSVTQIHL